MKVSYSAPAKLILSGDHSVVYGKPAIVAALDIRLQITLSSSPNQQKIIKPINLIVKTVLHYLKSNKLRFQEHDYHYSIDSTIPIGRGLGSSAALSVAGVAAFLEFFGGKKFHLETVNNIAFSVEKEFHKNPSGVDNTVSCMGGLIYFRREFEFLKSIFQLPFKIPDSIEKLLYLVDSGKPSESTGQMVSHVGTLFDKKPKEVKSIFDKMEAVTKRLVLSLTSENSKLFCSAIVENQKLLENLNVVSNSTKQLISQLDKFGVGKITGAGGRKTGSGFIFFYATQPKEFINFCKNKKIHYLKFNYSSQGLQRHAS